MSLHAVNANAGNGPQAGPAFHPQCSLHAQYANVHFKAYRLHYPLPPDENWVVRAADNISLQVRDNVVIDEVSKTAPIIISGATGAVNTVQFADRVMQALPNSQAANSNAIALSADNFQLAGKARVIGNAVAFPISVGCFVAECIIIDQERVKGRNGEILDASLRLIDATSSMADNISSFTEGLSMIGVIEVAAWAPPLGVAAGMLSLVTIPIHGREIYNSNLVYKALDGNNDEGRNGLDWLKEQLTNSDKKDGPRFLNKRFGIMNYEKYTNKTLDIIHCDDDEAKTKMLGAYKTRLKEKITAHKVAIVAAIILLIGVTILFFPILGPIWVALGLLALGAFIAFSRFCKERYSIKSLKNKINAIYNETIMPKRNPATLKRWETASPNKPERARIVPYHGQQLVRKNFTHHHVGRIPRKSHRRVG